MEVYINAYDSDDQYQFGTKVTMSDLVGLGNSAPSGDVEIVGFFFSGKILKADLSKIKDHDGVENVNYSWLRDGEVISGAASSQYTLSDLDVGKKISVQVSYTDNNGTSEGLTSTASTVAAAETSVDLVNA